MSYPARPRSWKRLVYVTEHGNTYHLVPHHDRYAVTWTQRFAHDGLEYRPCQSCFKGTRPRHRGHLVEEQGQIGWAALAPQTTADAVGVLDEAVK